jgi:ribosomal protein S30
MFAKESTSAGFVKDATQKYQKSTNCEKSPDLNNALNYVVNLEMISSCRLERRADVQLVAKSALRYG